ncbi:uncharacterized protein N7446_012501 [Penicillium canescens]|uniref:Secreted protein n=1 Tax=Penicillium canescens TaxID=5083 RepID=A0AAD6IA97_PENCN|nr:uncharacterized protein N7446_012501 [Penicillium canescens]KAJ6038699.1 hypothetical protein N7460_007416 [Penicillium canescens]KAJ6045637.1 hypothetical protein N7446_012501 [Penicillium canescens]
MPLPGPTKAWVSLLLSAVELSGVTESLPSPSSPKGTLALLDIRHFRTWSTITLAKFGVMVSS